MALQDIIDAIVAQADRDIAALRADHEKRVLALKTAHDADRVALKAQTAKQLAERKDLLNRKTTAHLSVERRNRVAEARSTVLDVVFAEVVAGLASLPEAKIEVILRACLKNIRGEGTLLPSKRHEAILKKIAPSERFTIGEHCDAIGGFRFIGTSTEADYTFEHLVHGVLRPQKELEIALSLFGA